MDLKATRDTMFSGYKVTTVLSDLELEAMRAKVGERVVELVAQRLAAQFVADHGQEIVDHLFPSSEAARGPILAELSRALMARR